MQKKETINRSLFCTIDVLARSSYMKDLSSISKKFTKLKENLKSALVQRFSLQCRESLKLTKIFDKRYQAKTEEEKVEQQKQIDKLVEIYHIQLNVNPLLLKNHLQQYVRYKKSYEKRTRKAFQMLIEEQSNLNKDVLFLRSKMKAMTFASAENERLFSTMNRIKD